MILIDTGMPGSHKSILNYLKNTLNREPEDIETIVITHHHFDHVGSLPKLKEITGAKIAIHAEDADYVAEKKSRSGSLFLRILLKIMNPIYKGKTVYPDILLKENDQIGNYKVIHTPGHTPGSICLYNALNGVIFVGDNLQNKGDKIEGPVKMFTPDIKQANESMKKLANLDIELLLSGHSSPLISNTKDKLNNYLETI